MSKLTVARLCLSGAIIGAAAASVVADQLGIPAAPVKEILGAALGGAAVLAIKALHVI